MGSLAKSKEPKTAETLDDKKVFVQKGTFPPHVAVKGALYTALVCTPVKLY